MRLSLRYKFILAFMAFTVVMASVSGIFVRRLLESQLRAQYSQYVVQLAKYVAAEIVEDQVLGVEHDPTLIAEHLLGEGTNLLSEEVLYAQIVLDGRVIAQQSRLAAL